MILTSLILCLPFLPAQVLNDRDRAFDIFRQVYPKHDTIEDNKILLKQRYDAAKAEAERVNSARNETNRLKGEIERVRVEAAMSSITAEGKGAEEGGAAASTSEADLRADLDHYKAVYKDSFQRLKDLKSEIEHIQRVLEASRLKMQADFEAWYADCLMKVNEQTHAEAQALIGNARPAPVSSTAGAAPSAPTPASSRGPLPHPSASSGPSKGPPAPAPDQMAWPPMQGMHPSGMPMGFPGPGGGFPAPPPGSAGAGAGHMPMPMPMHMHMPPGGTWGHMPMPMPMPGFMPPPGSRGTTPMLPPGMMMPPPPFGMGMPYPAPPSSAGAGADAGAGAGGTAPSTPFASTGSAEADADIAAFYKAKEELLRRAKAAGGFSAPPSRN